MDHSKLLDLLDSFSSREWRSFSEMVHSPFFNRNVAVTKLCDWLEVGASNLGTMNRKTAYEVVFPDAVYQDAKLNHTMSALLKLGEQFVGMQEFLKDGFLSDFCCLKGLSARGLEKHYQYQFKRKSQALETASDQGAKHYFELYQLENLEGYRRQQLGGQGFKEYVQRTADSLDNFYLAEKLRLICFMLTSERLLAESYKISLAEELNSFISLQPKEAHGPAVWAYHIVYQMLRKKKAHAEFEQLKSALPELVKKLNRSEIEEIYQHAINYCNLQIIQSDQRFLSEALHLYEWGLESGILLRNGQLSPWHFKNIIKLALRLAKFDWTEQFIVKKIPLLPPEFREDAFHYNLAELYYYTQQNDKALQHLNQVEFTDVSYHLGAKIMLAKIYYETDADDALDSLLHAFGIYLRRNRVISEDIRRTYLNFVAILRKITQSRPEHFAALQARIEGTSSLAAKSWLLKLVE